ncbi:hypothetical protein CMUS01_02988 [Colletotrichum musicola]|uniref:Uncharacterized protein n=1 Tax=Colletotrichum musicola TaxID=2175873 RepID=A0A8H6NTY2_9PEZI|nr:hypothetical protein CMUS01_02988 [Colletotrichum musicola]
MQRKAGLPAPLPTASRVTTQAIPISVPAWGRRTQATKVLKTKTSVVLEADREVVAEAEAEAEAAFQRNWTAKAQARIAELDPAPGPGTWVKSLRFGSTEELK